MKILITSGNGPIECMRFVYLFNKFIEKECLKNKLIFEIIDKVQGDDKYTYKSILVEIKGEDSLEYSNSIIGSHLWIWKSEYRPNHKRKAWYIEVQEIIDQEDIDISLEDIKIEKMRSSGNGGQHVNTTESAIRITHIKTGIVAISQDERSQYANIRKAKERLKKALEYKRSKERAKVREEIWFNGINIIRGNEKMKFEGNNFKRIK